MTWNGRFGSRKRTALSLLILLFLGFRPVISPAMELDPYPIYDFSRDPFSVAVFREERPSFYWVNIGVPDFFFNGIQQVSSQPNPTAYAIRSVEYGVQAKGWLDDRFQLKATFPFEANALVDPAGNTHNVSHTGDLEIGATYLLEGKRQKGNFIGVDGWYRFATGTNPFTLNYPILSTGKGAPEEAVGVVMAEELSGFSFFQSIHYQKTQPLQLDSTDPFLGAGVFQWPDDILAEGRVEWLAYHRAQRFVSLYYELRMRMSGLMEFNNQALPYGQIPGGQFSDHLFFSKVGLLVRVDKEFSAEGSLSYFPAQFNFPGYRPADGWIFSLSVIFRPI